MTRPTSASDERQPVRREWRSSQPVRYGIALAVLVSTFSLTRPAPAEPQQASARHTSAAAAWDALHTGRLHDAAVLFRRALVGAPRDPSRHVGAGLVSHLLNRPAEAQASLAEALRLEPRLTEASLLLGHVLYRQGDLAGAIRVYEDALAYAPGHQLLEEKLARWRAEADIHAHLDARLGNNFTVLFEGATDGRLADRVLEVLEAAYWRIGSELAIYPTTPITVVLYTEQQFAEITRSPRWAAAAFDGTIRVPIRGALEQEAELERLLAHEVTHAIVSSVAPSNVPFWLSEGLAVVIGERKEVPPPPPELESDAEVTLSALHTSFAGLTPAQAEAAYAQSARATRALIERIGAVGVGSLLSDLGAGIAFETAFAARVPMSYAEFATGSLRHD